MSFQEENEISIKANGGTEITKRLLSNYVPENVYKNFQIIPSRIRDFDKNKKIIYWAHDLPEDPECQKIKYYDVRSKFSKIVFVSNWQANNFIDQFNLVQNDKICVIENPIEPMPILEKESSIIKIVYFSTPHRGLEILVPVFEELCKKYANIHLDVFSSFKIYGFNDGDFPYEYLFDRIKKHPNMTYHGSVNQKFLYEYLPTAHILAYPSIWKETSCRVLIESMSASLLCVHSSLGALPDTSGGMTDVYQYQSDKQQHYKKFFDQLEKAIKNVLSEETKNKLLFVKKYADMRFGIINIAKKWDDMMLELIDKGNS